MGLGGFTIFRGTYVMEGRSGLLLSETFQCFRFTELAYFQFSER